MISLYYCKNNNFGDVTAPYIVQKLSGDKAVFNKPFNLQIFFRALLSYVHQLSKGRNVNRKELFAFTFQKVLFATGSIIENCYNNSIVWGAGIAQPNKKVHGGEFLMTRGPLSKKIVEQNGFVVKSSVCGDPALLLPRLYYPQIQKKFRVGIIPHYSHYDEINTLLQNSLTHDTKLINLKTSDIEIIIREILSCEYIYSESLHGIIVSQAYYIPVEWFSFKKITGGDFKFYDHLHAIGKPNYKCKTFESCLKTNFNLQENEEYYRIQHSLLTDIQNELLKTFPFSKLK